MKEEVLLHYRTPGSKNGVRLYQNKDGSLTPAGERRYLKGSQWNSRYKKSSQSSESNNSSIKEKVIMYTPGKVGELLRTGSRAYGSVKKYYDNIQDHPTSLETVHRIQKIKGFVEPYKFKVDKAIYSVNKTVKELTQDKELIDSGAEYMNDILSRITGYVNDPEIGLYDFLKYLNKKSKESSANSHKYDDQIKSPSNWMSFGGGRPRIKQTR